MKKIAIGSLIVGVVSLTIQALFYGDVQTEGFVIDSIFLPIGVLSLLVSVMVWVLIGIRVTLNKK